MSASRAVIPRHTLSRPLCVKKRSSVRKTSALLLVSRAQSPAAAAAASSAAAFSSAFFLFLAGLEIDFRGIEGRLRELILPFLLSVLAFTMSMTIAIQLGWGIWVAAGAAIMGWISL